MKVGELVTVLQAVHPDKEIKVVVRATPLDTDVSTDEEHSITVVDGDILEIENVGQYPDDSIGIHARQVL